MRRNAIAALETWLNNKRRKPLILWGARQVGKTYLIRDIFAEEHFSNTYIYIDFRVENVIRDYCSETVDAGDIINFISVAKNKKIDSSTLLIFDEIQECPAIITALKYFCQDYREIPVIATGSMVRIKLKRMANKRGVRKEEPFLFPVGKINQLTLYPMTFDEFLLNYNQRLYEYVVSSYREKQPLERNYHELAMDALYIYMLIGGMPEAVDTYLETGDLQESRDILKDLYDNYLADMELYQASPEAILKSQRIFNNIYRELNKESKNFSPGIIEKGSKVRDYLTALDWLTLAHVVYKSMQLKEHIVSPLSADSDSAFRLFLADVGMFAYQSNATPESFIERNSRNMLTGIFIENYVATELSARDLPLFYWKGKNNSEIEFVVESGGKLYPIDAKKTKGSLPSLEKYKQHNKLDYAIKVSANNYGYNEEKKILTVPLYEVFLIAEDLKDETRIEKTRKK